MAQNEHAAQEAALEQQMQAYRDRLRPPNAMNKSDRPLCSDKPSSNGKRKYSDNNRPRSGRPSSNANQRYRGLYEHNKRYRNGKRRWSSNAKRVRLRSPYRKQTIAPSKQSRTLRN